MFYASVTEPRDGGELSGETPAIACQERSECYEKVTCRGSRVGAELSCFVIFHRNETSNKEARPAGPYAGKDWKKFSAGKERGKTSGRPRNLGAGTYLVIESDR